MRMFQLAAAIAAALVLTLWAAGIPGGAQPAAAQDGLTRTITLTPGFNLVVWGDTDVAAEDLVTILPSAVGAVFAWNVDTAEFDTFRPEGPAFVNTLTQVDAGAAVWLLVEGDAAVEFEQNDIDAPRQLSVRGGLDLLGWTGPTTPIPAIIDGLGEVRINVYDNAAKQFRVYATGLPDSLQGVTELNPGDGFWVEAAPGAPIPVPGRTPPPPGEPQTITLTPVADTTIYSEGTLSNGAGTHLFAGTTNNGEERRALLRFNLLLIPDGATITQAELRLRMTRSNAGEVPVTLRRVTADWGEAGSDAAAEEGRGAPAESGDATWNHAFFDSVPWESPGGDFAGIVSATALVAGVETYTWTGTLLDADVQGWNNGDPNFGWIVLVEGVEGSSAKRFESRSTSNAPELVVEYVVE
jgi:hypothetical protein